MFSSWLRLLCCSMLLGGPAAAQFQFQYSQEERTWTLSNGLLRAVLSLRADGKFGLQSLEHLREGVRWRAPAGGNTAPFRLRTTQGVYDENTAYELVQQSSRPIARQGYRQTIVLQDQRQTARIAVELEMFANQPVLRYRTLLQNRLGNPVIVRAADVLPWSLASAEGNYRVFRVNQWVNGGRDGNFEPLTTTLSREGQDVRMLSGAHGQHCAWVAIRDARDAGLFAGWEFDGRMDLTVRRAASDAGLAFASSIQELNRPLGPNQTFMAPGAFLGLFQGDWDEAAWRTQRFTEAAIAQPTRDPDFPYVIWDSWGYQMNIDDVTLRRNAEIAARLGIEVFVVDLGWARHIGDWHADPKKFPNGLRPLSDYVHSLGMKFGLHFPLAEASPISPVLLTNPDWTSTMEYGYFDAWSLCLSHRPVRDWIIAEAVRMIDEYNVDWILQDGENMVKHCTKRTHTHAPDDSNYSNAVDGLNFVVAAVQAQRPNVRWENCQDGGNMMTYNMTRLYVTSIAADDSGELTTRQAIHGVTYPFSPRYADRYMPHDEINPYVTRSYMFGGPWIFMNHLPAVDADSLEVAATEIALFKKLRSRLRDGKVLHLTGRPNGRINEAIGSYHEPTDSVITFLFRPDYSTSNGYTLRFRMLQPDRVYLVRFENSGGEQLLTGRQISENGIRVRLPHPWYADIVYVEPAPASMAGEQ